MRVPFPPFRHPGPGPWARSGWGAERCPGVWLIHSMTSAAFPPWGGPGPGRVPSPVEGVLVCFALGPRVASAHLAGVERVARAANEAAHLLVTRPALPPRGRGAAPISCSLLAGLSFRYWNGRVFVAFGPLPSVIST